MDCLWFSEKNQQGKDFGERFTNALQAVFNAGYEKVIAIGNDCLSLNYKELLSAVCTLEKNKVVLGPSNDGGVYLIGMHKDVFNYNRFLAIQWQTPAVFDEIRNLYASQGINTQVLKNKTDIDDLVDLVKEIENKALPYHLINKIVALLKPFTIQFIFYKSRLINQYCLNNLPLRAPPDFR